MKKDIIRKGILLFVIVVICAMAVLVFVNRQYRQNLSRAQELSGPWNVDYKGQILLHTTYEEFLQNHTYVEKGMKIVCAIPLPQAKDEGFPTLMLKTKQSAVEVYVGFDLIYSSGLERVREGKYVGRHVHFVNLPADYAGKVLTVKLYVSHDGNAFGYSSPLLGNFQTLYSLYIEEALPALCTGSFLLVFGIVFLFITLFFITESSGVHQQILSSLVCLDMGVWMLCYFELVQLFVSDVYSTVVEYVALYLLLVFFLAMFGYMSEKVKQLRTVALVLLFLTMLTVLLHASGIVFIDVWATVYHAGMLVTFIAVLAVYFRRLVIREKRMPFSPLDLGILFLDLSMLLYMLIFIAERQLGMSGGRGSRLLPIIGALSFVVAQMLHYYLNVSETYARQRELQSLTHMAYVDMLTGLPNRKSAMNIFINVDSTKSDYCVVSLDLNGLKTVNDRDGHRAGDELLRTTATVLNTVFADYGFRARLSGDEFLVVMKSVTEETVKGCIRRMDEMMRELTETHPGTDYSIASGYAFKSDFMDLTAGEIFRIADERMYENKKSYYNSKSRGGKTA